MSYTRQSVKTVKVFYSYSHKDKGFRKDIEDCLFMLKKQGIIEDWCDRKIGAGKEWVDEINRHLNTADIILLLVSPAFLKSGYCYDVEVARAMERHEVGHARVIPVILRPCEWMNAPFSKLQALPKASKPVEEWKKRDKALRNIAKGIRKTAEEMIASSPGEKNSPADPPRYVKPPMHEKYRNLIPHLCDRNEQLIVLEEAIHGHQPNRPFICVVDGDERECHEMFLDRLLQRSLPRILKLKEGQPPIKDYSMAWPSNYKPSPDPLDSFRAILTRMLECDSKDSQEDMARKLASRQNSSIEKDPVVIHTFLDTEDWKPAGREMIKSFIKCWNEWPDLPTGQILIVCILFEYMKGEQRDFWVKQKWARYKEEIRTFFRQFKSHEYRNLSGIPLLELGPISRKDARDWVRTEVRSIQGDKFRIGDCSKRIRSLYAKRKAIEMEELADHFNQMIDNC